MLLKLMGKKVFLAFISIVFAIPAWCQEVMFTIDGDPSHADEFEYVYSKNSFNNPEAFTRQDMEEYLQLFINFKLKVAEARTMGLDTLKSLKNEFESYKVELQKPYLSDEKLTDSLILIAYDRLKEEVRASHILIFVEPEASPEDTLEAFSKIMDIRKMAIQGNDFSELAEAYSEDPGGKANGGDLGYFTSMQMVYPFEEAAFNMAVGQVSPPIRTRFGYHIIKLFDRRPSRGKIEASHIMVRFGQDMTTEDSLEKKNHIFEIWEQLQAGYNWEEMVRTYSEDVSTNTRGGLLRAFRTGEVPPSFSEAALSLKNVGDISDPFRTPYGWHIVRLENILGIEDLDEVRGTIRSRINSDARGALKQKALVEKILRENDIQLNRTLFDEYRTTPVSGIPAGELNRKILEVEDRVITISELVENIDNRPLEIFVDQFLINWEKDHLEEKYPEYRHLLSEYWEGILLFQIMDDMVWKKAASDSVGLEAFFNNNRKKYTWDRRINGRLFKSPDPSTLDSLVSFTGTFPDSLDTRGLMDMFNKSSALNLRGYQGPFEEGSGILPPDVPWTPGIHKGKEENIFYVIYVDEILDPGPRKLEEAKGLVISDYQEYLEDKWVEELRKKYDVDVNKKVVRNVFKRLEK